MKGAVKVQIRWLGHACFLLADAEGRRLVTDPFDPQIGYPAPKVAADVVTVSHDHFDHNAIDQIQGQPEVIQGAGKHEAQGLDIYGLATFHDDQGGRQRGNNTVFRWVMDGVRVCHLGDLGHALTPAQVAEIGPQDVLMVPVGGFFTIDAVQARQVVEAIKPRIVLPMHYKTPALPAQQFPIQGVDEFSRQFPRVTNQEFLEVSAGTRPEEMTVIILALPA
ncbi:MAG: MBL fold metallo-hydrolase [Clostridia bacterium]|nr:MAG: MBL fold metallo-hydrolase [Clostridia bacterium]